MKVKEGSETLGLKLNIQKTKIMASGPSLHGTQMGKQWKQCQTLSFWAPKITADGDRNHEIKTLTLWKESYDQPNQHIKKQRHYFANKGQSGQGYGLSSGHVWM